MNFLHNKIKKNLAIATIIIIVVGIFCYSIYQSIKFESVAFNTVDLSKSKNDVVNFSSVPYLDTLAHVMMTELKLENTEIILYDVTDAVRSNIFKSEIVNGFVVERFDGILQVFVYPSKTRVKTFQILAHEIIHVSQVANKKLQVLNSSTAVWDSDTLNIKEIEYMNRGWEIEAYNNQNRLANSAKRILIP
jgi:hypothetical protein